MSVILYVHGMGGGADSRIPGYLKPRLSPCGAEVVVRTYEFNPEAASAQIGKWVEELKPDLIIGESMGANYAARIGSVPRLFVSPALGAPRAMTVLRTLVLIPGMGRLLGRLFPRKEGERQEVCFGRESLSGFKALCDDGTVVRSGKVRAFFGRRDHYRRWGIVSIRKWTRLFGRSTYATYDGTHYMEEPFIESMLIPEILSILDESPQDIDQLVVLDKETVVSEDR